MTRLTFHGGAGTVTGSRHLFEHAGRRVLIDCGLFQGPRELRERNWRSPGFEPRALDAVILTHAHIDHSGYLPALARDGYDGAIFATPATLDLADLLLRDSAMIQEEDAEYANRKGFSRHHPALPLYTVADAVKAIGQLVAVKYDLWHELPGGLRFRFVRAGHILGSAMVELEARDAERPLRCLFTGDVGRYDAPLVPDPTPPRPCDVLVVESTYGDRKHPEIGIEEQLRDALRYVVETRGTLLVPSFAVGRAQQLLVLLRGVMDADHALDVAIHLDSPMAVDTTKIYRHYPEEKGLEAVDLHSGSSRIYGHNVYLHRTRDESLRLNELDGPRVLVSSSGMLAGGRVLHHLKRLLPDPKNAILLAGYQAPGTRGWRLQRGDETIRVHGRDVDVRARLHSISGLSAHADADQLLRWARDLPPPARTFVVHGDGGAARALAGRLERELGFRCDVPQLGDSFAL